MKPHDGDEQEKESEFNYANRSGPWNKGRDEKNSNSKYKILNFFTSKEDGCQVGHQPREKKKDLT